MQKNQKIKATLQRLQILFASLKSRKLALRAQTTEISLRSAWNLLYASSVRPVYFAFIPIFVYGQDVPIMQKLKGEQEILMDLSSAYINRKVPLLTSHLV